MGWPEVYGEHLSNSGSEICKTVSFFGVWGPCLQEDNLKSIYDTLCFSSSV